MNRGPDHLILATVRRAFQECGQPVPDIAVHCENNIPHGRGLGSSSAAIVTGLAGARGLGARLDEADVLALATRIEGHPDNVAPALLGGLTISWMQGVSGRAVRLDPAAGWPPRLRCRTTVFQPPPPGPCCLIRFHSVTPSMFWDAARWRLRRSPRTRNCSCPPPRTGSTRATVRRPIRSRWPLCTNCANEVSLPPSQGRTQCHRLRVGLPIPDGWRRLEVPVATEGVRVSGP